MHRRLLPVLSCAWLLSAALPALAVEQAGKVIYALGATRAIGADGSSRALGRGSPVLSGDELVTDQGRLQVGFSDGGYVALQPDTRFRVDDYHFSDDTDGNERSFLQLLRGGMRFVTGAIGKRNRAAYKISTTVATIGIRGSGGRADLCVAGSCGERADGLYLTGNEDVLTLSNEQGSEDVRPGDTLFVACLTCAITHIDAGPLAHRDLTPAPPSLRFERGEQRVEEGALVALATAEFPLEPPVVPPVEPPVEPPLDPVVPLLSGSGPAAVTAIGDNGSFLGGLLGGALTFDGAGALTAYQDGVLPANTFSAPTVHHFDADGLIAWGLWTAGTAGGGYASGLGTSAMDALSYAASLSATATSSGTLANLNGTYEVYGSTPPIALSGGVATLGSADSVSGSFNVDFSGNSVGYSLAVPLAGQTFTLAGTATFVNGGPGDTRFLGGGSITSNGSGCNGGCSGVVPFGPDLQGFVTGLSGERIGANYGFTSDIGKVTGAVVAKPAASP